MTVQRNLLAWYRQGLSTAVTGVPAAGTLRAELPALMTLTGSSTTHDGEIPVQLAGPGDVVGLDLTEVRRCEPYDGCPDFEPEYLAYIELASADLPWRFSPVGQEAALLANPENPAAEPVTQSRLMPWLALVVLPADLAEVSPASAGGLAVLTCPLSELPVCEEAWAWAHTQVDTTGGVDPVAAGSDRSRSIARIVSPRRLKPGIAYRAFLVPTFSAGVGAARIDTGGRAPLGPAWDAGPDASSRATLPIYYTWSFGTAQAGTFEALARRLHPREAPTAAAGLPVKVEAAGWGMTGPAGQTVLMQGALRPLGPASDPLPDATIAGQVAKAISSTGPGLQLRPPIYGQDYAGGRTALSAGDSGWLADLNLDPRRRLAAGLGAWAVAVNQEDLADRSWRQLASAGLARVTSADPELAGVLSGTVSRRNAGTTAGVLPSTLARLVRPGGPIARTGTAIAPALSARFAGLEDTPAPAHGTQPLKIVDTNQAAASRFAPVFGDAGYTLLEGVAPQWLLPGIGDIPDDSILLMRSNPAFTEAFLIGANHALARELNWRRFPLQETATMFDRFWASASGSPGNRIKPIADWDPASPLGSHSPGTEGLVLLIRGSILRRFPTISIYLVGLRPDGTEQHLTTTMAATVAPGTSFFGFPITAADALVPPAGSGVTSWSVVLQESVDHVRFGLNPPPDTGGTTAVNSWADLDWANSHMTRHRPDGSSESWANVPVSGPLLGVSRPRSASTGSPSVTWGADSAQLAAALTRPAFRLRIPVDLWLMPTSTSPDPSNGPVT